MNKWKVFIFLLQPIAVFKHKNTGRILGERKPSPTLYWLFCVVFARWQHYTRRRFALSGNGKESFNPILDPDADPDADPPLSWAKSSLSWNFQPSQLATFCTTLLTIQQINLRLSHNQGPPSPRQPWRNPSPSLTFPFLPLPLEVGPLLRLMGMGERISSPSGSGRSPAAKRYLVNFRLTISAL